MTTTEIPSTPEPTAITARPFPVHEATKGSLFSQLLRTTDHKMIGRMYLATSFAFFVFGGVLA
jgi:cytochrome c oxidase subunit 1